MQGSGQKRSLNQSKPSVRSDAIAAAARTDSADTALSGRGGGGGYNGARSAEAMLQRGEKPRQPHGCAGSVRQHEHKSSEDQGKH